MARIIDVMGADTNVGEERMVQVLAEFLDDHHIAYRNRTIYGRELDVFVVIPDVGLLVIEVKGWKESTVNQVLDGHRISINTESGIREEAPRRQAKGYRNALENYLRHELGKYPLVFAMVAYPFISRDFYLEKGMDRVSEEAFTFLQDDLVSGELFRVKLQAAKVLTQRWSRAALTDALLLQVRSLFEVDVVDPTPVVKPEDQPKPLHASSWLVPIYSKLCYIADNDPNGVAQIDQLVELYKQGTKVFLITPQSALLNYAAQMVGQAFAEKHLRSENGALTVSLHTAAAPPEVRLDADGFRCFNFQASRVRDSQTVNGTASFALENGAGLTRDVRLKLVALHAVSSFNLHQYEVEHADAEKGVLVRAGAGTGKTHVMISRILFLCYADGITGTTIRKRINMITFTNDAADNMKKRLKSTLKQYYLLTGQAEFLDLVAQVDSMRISTIHAFARSIIEQLGTEVGLGRDFSITSAEAMWQETLAEVLEVYLGDKVAADRDYLSKLDMPVWELRDHLSNFADQLNNKSADIAKLKPEHFGQPGEGTTSELFHELVRDVLPQAEATYKDELVCGNKLHLQTIMSSLSQVVQDSAQRLLERKEAANQYLFVDEFQDTDDVQIDALLRLSAIMDYGLFVVGDIKQCIYRFRGAEEKAFDKLGIEQNPDNWLCFELTKNYRTDKHLLAVYQESFEAWGRQDLLTYDRGRDELTSDIDLNGAEVPAIYYRRIRIDSKDDVLPRLLEEVRSEELRLRSLLEQGHRLNPNERTIAILVRENWQAEQVRKAGKDHGYPNIKTHTGGDLYQSAPALDLLTLAQTLLNNRQPANLYALLTSNFFQLPVRKQALYDARHRVRDTNTAAERQSSLLIKAIDDRLAELGLEGWSWQGMLQRLRQEPILQVLRQLYGKLKPWSRYSQDKSAQRFYRMNLDLVFERIIESVNIDSLTINRLAAWLQAAVSTQRAEDCRWPDMEDDEITIACYTVHKSKGLEYGSVLLPYCGFPIGRAKPNKLDVTYTGGQVGYRLKLYGRALLANDQYDQAQEAEDRIREETRVLYVAMTRAIRAFTWIELANKATASWQTLLGGER